MNNYEYSQKVFLKLIADKERYELALENIKGLALDYARFSQEQSPLVEGMYKYAENALTKEETK